MSADRLFLFCLCAPWAVSICSAQGQSSVSLNAVHAIAVGSFGGDRDSKQLAGDLAARLRHHAPLHLAQPAQADATLDGQGSIWVHGYHSLSPRARINDAYAEPAYVGYLSVTLQAKNGDVLWSYFASSKNAGSRSEVGKDLASQVLDALSSAIGNASAMTSASNAASVAKAATLRGGGATFPFPIYQRWFTSFNKAVSAITITYNPLGSSAGVAGLSAGEFDFAGTDVPLSVLKPARQCLALPTVAGAVVLVYNVPEFSGVLRLTPEVAADILRGKITKWNDAALQELNSGSGLPNQPIRVIHRHDASGTTFAFTQYMSEVVPQWKESVGVGDRVSWPVGEGVTGNEGVAAAVADRAYAFGYAEFIYAFRRKLGIASIRNAAGKFVQPDLAGISTAAAAMSRAIPPDFNLSLANAPGRDAYPISTLTWIVVPREGIGSEKRTAIKRLLEWILGPGQSQAMSLGYVPLPKALIEEELKAVATLDGSP